MIHSYILLFIICQALFLHFIDGFRHNLLHFQKTTTWELKAKRYLDFLEVDTCHDMTQIPLLTFTAKEPYVATVLSVERLVSPAAANPTYKITLDHAGHFRFWEGQSCGVIPPGVNPKTNKPNVNRLYSIASTRYGDDYSGQTISLCVKRSIFIDPTTGKEDPNKQGICSNFLCGASPGEKVHLTGPQGKVLLLPEKTPDADIIMIATGTGIAPFRAFLRRLFVESNPVSKTYSGLAWLLFGIPNRDSILFVEELSMMKQFHPDHFRLNYALSREEKNSVGEKAYVQDEVQRNAAEIFERIQLGGHIYFCGLKAMMPDIMTVLENESKKRSLVWSEVLKKWKEEGRWHVEVY